MTAITNTLMPRHTPFIKFDGTRTATAADLDIPIPFEFPFRICIRDASWCTFHWTFSLSSPSYFFYFWYCDNMLHMAAFQLSAIWVALVA